MLKALFEVQTQGSKGKKKVRVKRIPKAMLGKWIIAADLEDVTLGDGVDLQTMINALPEKGGKLLVSGGVYELSEPLQIPDSKNSNISIIGCTFMGADKPRTIHPGTVHIEGKMDQTLYWNGKIWKAEVEDALGFDSKEAAEDEGFALITRTPKLLAQLDIVQVTK